MNEIVDFHPQEIDFLRELMRFHMYPNDSIYELNYSTGFKYELLKKLDKLADFSIKPPTPFPVGGYEVYWYGEKDERN